MIIFVNQLGLYWAVSITLINELPEDHKAPGKLFAVYQTDQEIPTQILSSEVEADDERQGNLWQYYERRFEKLPEDQKLFKLCSEAR